MLTAGPRSACADPVSELASFSIFDKVDLAQLAKSDVKTAHGPPMRTSRFLAVQSCYVAPGALLRRAGCARTADGSIAQMGPHNASRIKGVPAY